MDCRSGLKGETAGWDSRVRLEGETAVKDRRVNCRVTPQSETAVQDRRGGLESGTAGVGGAGEWGGRQGWCRGRGIRRGLGR